LDPCLDRVHFSGSESNDNVHDLWIVTKRMKWSVSFCWYCRYEREGRGRRVLPARKLWDHIIGAQIETGTPYMLYKDACNRKSNQQNLGTIACSNLCTEIIEYCDKDEVWITAWIKIMIELVWDGSAHNLIKCFRMHWINIWKWSRPCWDGC